MTETCSAVSFSTSTTSTAPINFSPTGRRHQHRGYVLHASDSDSIMKFTDGL
jgi:hypothetical protein